VGSLNSAHIHGTDVPVEEPSTASNWEVRARNREVGFTPNSGRGLTLRKLTLCAKRRHSPTYSITSSARASSDWGTSRPSAPTPDVALHRT